MGVMDNELTHEIAWGKQQSAIKTAFVRALAKKSDGYKFVTTDSNGNRESISKKRFTRRLNADVKRIEQESKQERRQREIDRTNYLLDNLTTKREG